MGLAAHGCDGARLAKPGHQSHSQEAMEPDDGEAGQSAAPSTPDSNDGAMQSPVRRAPPARLAPLPQSKSKTSIRPSARARSAAAAHARDPDSPIVEPVLEDTAPAQSESPARRSGRPTESRRVRCVAPSRAWASVGNRGVHDMSCFLCVLQFHTSSRGGAASPLLLRRVNAASAALCLTTQRLCTCLISADLGLWSSIPPRHAWRGFAASESVAALSHCHGSCRGS